MSSPTPLRYEQVLEVLASATAAASVLNTQPWAFELGRDSINLFADESRHAHLVDPERRQLVMSCGCALLNLRLAVAAMVREPLAEIFPTDDESHVARIGFGQARAPAAEESRLYAAIPRRRTNRRPFSPEQPPPEAVDDLIRAAAMEQASLRLLVGAEAAQVVEIVHEADRRQQADLALWAEVARWIEPATDRSEGLPIRALGPAPRTRHAVTRDFAFGRVVPGRAVSDFESQPVLLLLSTPGDSRRDWVAAGQALQRVQLTATSLGIATSFLGQVLEVRDLRAALAEAAAQPGGCPQMLLRAGYAADSPPTPRRPVESVLRSHHRSVDRGEGALS